MDLKPPDESNSPTVDVTKATSPISVSNCFSSAFSSATKASTQTTRASSVDPALRDVDFLETPPANTVQSTAENLPPADSSITHDPIAVVEESLPLVISYIAKVHTLDEDSEKETANVHPLEDVEEQSSNPPSVFVPSLGAWAKPLAFAPPATPPTPSTPSDFDPKYLNKLLDSFWPSLTEGLGQNQKKRDHQSVAREFPLIPVQKIPVPELKDDGTLRFPWAARMNPATRNLYRAANPTFRLDGTPQVSIPSQVLTLGPENKKEYVIGQFHRCSLPPGGLIHAVVNRLWGRSCRIGCRKISELSYMFHIPHESTRQWVVQRGVWHVDDCLLFISPWTPVNSLKVPEISTIPVWVNLKNVPDCCYSRLGLSHVASGLGEPMQTHKPRLDPTTLGEAKLLVEVELDKPFPKQIALDDKQGNIFLVDVEYTWIPSTCGRCGQLGHKEKRCLLPVPEKCVETSFSADLSKKAPEAEIETEQAQVTVVSDQEMTQVETSEMETQVGVVLKDHSTPPSCPTNSLVTVATCSNSQSILPPLADSLSFQLATSKKDNSVNFCQSSPDVKSTLGSTLAGISSAHTSLQIMDDVPSDIIINEGVTHSRNDPLTMTFLSTESNQYDGSMESDFHITEQLDEFGSVTRRGRLIKPTQKYQEMEWTKVSGRGKRGRRGRSS